MSSQSLPTLLELKRECHALIEAIARKPASINLLLGARRSLQTFAQYKSNRKQRWSQRSTIDED